MINKIKCVTLGLAIAVVGSSIFGAKAIANDSPLDIAKQFEINGDHYDFDGDGDVNSNDIFLLNIAAQVGRDQSGIDSSISAHKGASELTVDQIKERIAKAYREGRLDFDSDGTVTNFDAYAALTFTMGFTGDQLRPSNIHESFERNGHRLSEFKPEYVADFRGDIRVTHNASIGELDVGWLKTHRLAKLLHGAKSNGEISAPLITTTTINTDNATVGTINANVVDTGVIKSTGVAELGGVVSKGAISAGIVTSENIASSAHRTEFLHVTKTANIGQALATEVRSNSLKAKHSSVEDLTAKKAGIDALGAKEAKIESLKARDIKVDSRIQVNETFTDNLFVGTHDANNLDNTTTAIVAYEKVVLGDIEETDEMKDLKSQIESNEKLAERYYGYAKRFARYSWAGNYKKAADSYANRAMDMKAELQDLIEQQGTGTKKVARVGVGVSDPQQTLHLSGAMRMEPLSAAPENAQAGDMYVDSSEALCVYLGDTWNYVTGPGSCSGN